MKTTSIYLLLSMIFLSCNSYKSISYKWGKSKVKFSMNVPKGYIFEGFSGDHESEKRFWYPDSSVIFITDFSNTINYDEIRKQGTYYERFWAVHNDDTLTLAGIDSLGRLWKDKKLKNVTVGYHGVLLPNKEIFEKAINSARRN